VQFHWKFVKSIIPAGFASQGVLNEDPTVWLDKTRPPLLVSLVLPLPENEFSRGAQYLTGENLKVVCAEFLYLS
jgi:hypothetical protein